MSPVELVAACAARGITVATAESLTAGLVASAIADVPGCSAVFRGGVVAYATDIKGTLLGVSSEDLEHVVSEQVVAEMARAVCRELDADLGIATTGVAGPDSLDGQAPGSVWIAVHDRTSSSTRTEFLALSGDRRAIREAAVRAALALAEQAISV